MSFQSIAASKNTSHAPGEALDLDEVFERVLVDDNGRKLVLTTGKPGILWKLDRQTGQYIGHKETVFQNIFDSIDPKTGTPTYRGDIIEAKVGQWVSACPSTQGGKNWHAATYHPAAADLIPLNQTCLEISGRLVEFKEGSGGSQADRRFSRCRAPTATSESSPPTTYNNARSLELRAARGVPVRRAVDRRRPRLRRRPRPNFRAFDVRTGKVLWQTRLGTSVQGFPMSFAANGKQYVAVSTGLGGGSPRNVPRRSRRRSSTRRRATRCTCSP